MDKAKRQELADAIAQAILAQSQHKVDGKTPQDIESGDIDYLELIGLCDIAIEEGALIQSQAVQQARRGGASWAQIGSVLGISRQAAQQRFTGQSEEPAPEDHKILTGMHLFNEMLALEQEGRKGYHLVDFGPLYLKLAPSEHQWQHKRIIIVENKEKLMDEGWQYVATWFPFQYFKRKVQ